MPRASRSYRSASKFAAHRFAHQAAPALARFADSSPGAFVSGIRASRERIVARSEEDRETFLRKRGFSKGETAKIIAIVLREEGHPPASVFDFVQGITAVARAKHPELRRLARAIRPEPWMGRAEPIHHEVDPFAAAAITAAPG